MPTDDVPGDIVEVGYRVVDTPPPADAAVLGPAFGFYKGGEGDGRDGAACFAACSDCLMNSIDGMHAVNTKCELETAEMKCWMGFEVAK